MPLLGHVTAPNGTLLVIDAGLLSMWSGRRPPMLAEFDADPSTVAIANSAVDYELVGGDRAAIDRVGRALDRQANPRFLFDIPAGGRGDPVPRRSACRLARRWDPSSASTRSVVWA